MTYSDYELFRSVFNRWSWDYDFHSTDLVDITQMYDMRDSQLMHQLTMLSGLPPAAKLAVIRMGLHDAPQ